MINITKLKDVFKDKTIPDQDLLEAYRTLTIRFIDIEQRLRSLELNEVDLNFVLISMAMPLQVSKFTVNKSSILGNRLKQCNLLVIGK
jgi:hypothetical protein